MKNKKAFKILTLALTLAVLAVGLCFAAAAADEPSVSIIAKNVSYDDVVQVMFAVDDTNAGADAEIELLYYLEDPTVNSAATAYKGIAYDKGYTDDNGDTYPAFYSAGFPAKHIGDKVYARAHIVGTEIYSEVVRYSVVEYLLERLYVDRATGDKKALYEDLLSYGASAQKVLINGNTDPADDIKAGEFVIDYVLVGIENGTLDGKYDQGIYFVDDKVYPQADGIATWNATVYDLSTGVGTTTEVNGGAAYTVTGFTMFTAKTEGEAPAPAYKPDLTDTEGRDTYESGTEPVNFTWNNWLDGGGLGTLEIVDGAPYGVASKVQHFNTPEGTKPEISFMFSTKPGATTVVIENDFMFTSTGLLLPKFELRNSSGVAFGFFIGAQNGEVGLLDENQNIIGKLANDGEWFRLRIEIVDAGDGTSNVLFYLNDNRIAQNYNFTASAEAKTINRFRFWTEQAHTGDIYFDNTKFSSSYSPDLSDMTGRESYDNGTMTAGDGGNKYNSDLFEIDPWAPASSMSIVDATPWGVSSKAYLFKLQGASGSQEINIKPTSRASGANYIKFETDIMIDNVQANSMIEIQLRGSGDSGYPKFYLYTYADGTVELKNSSASTVAVISDIGEWFRFGFEYIKQDGNVVINMYVNETKLDVTGFVGTADPSVMNRVRIMPNTGAKCDIYFDNTKVEFLAK